MKKSEDKKIPEGKEVQMRPDQDESFILNLVKMVREHPPAKAAFMVQTIFDNVYDDIPEKVECYKGCSYCCYSTVSITELEMKAIEAHIRHKFSKEKLDLVIKSAKTLKKKYQSIKKEDRVYSRDACPLLIEGRCSVYESRPLMCRSAFSTSSEACKIAHSDPEFPVPMLTAPKAFADEMFIAILIAEGKKEYELTIPEGILKSFK